MSNSQKEDVICDKYRAVAVLCATCKILANISCVKLVTYSAEIIGEYQEGFSRGSSTVDQIFTMRQILGKCCEQNKEIHRIFIRFQTAYDTVWRKEIWSEVQKQGFPHKNS
jgi:hypothetical protein